MALNLKLAMLVSLGFIASMCWLVNQVARPILEQEPAAGRPFLPGGIHTPQVMPGANQESAADRFVRASPADASIMFPAIEEEGASPATVEPGGAFVQAELPPLHVPHVPADEPSTPAAATEPTLRRPPSLSALAYQPSPDTMKSEGLLGELPAVTRREIDTATVYRVQRGDSLSRVARRIWGSDQGAYIRMLLEANPPVARRGGRLLAGEQLVIPGSRGGANDRSAARADSSVQASRPPAATAGNDSGLRTAKAARSSQGAQATRGGASRAVRSYTIRSGDSLHGIAERVLKDANRWREIARLNGLKDANKLIPGARLRLPAEGSDT